MRLHFQRQGDGFPLVILHGLLGSLDNWETVSRKLGEPYQVLAVDQRNHGRSPHSEVFNYDAMVEDLREFLEEQRIHRAHVMGHSMGGKTAMHFALRHPELVEKLIVVDMAPKAYAPRHEPIFEALSSVDLKAFRERSAVGEALATSIPDTAMRQFLLKNVGRDEAGAFRWKMNLPVIRRNYNGLNLAMESDRTFDGPTLFIKGGLSDYIEAGDVALINQLFPRATFKTVEKAGHWVHADAPEKLVKIVFDFLR
jgi:esterase